MVRLATVTRASEMARTIEDVLSRRTRQLYLDARASLEGAESVAEILAIELRRDATWKADQLQEYDRVVKAHLAFG